jgi:hypothetical protein
MSNTELRTFLDGLLQSGEIDKETITLLMDAVIHATLVSKSMGLEQTAAEFLGMCIGHNMLAGVLGAEYITKELHDGGEKASTMSSEEGDRARKLLESVFGKDEDKKDEEAS